MSALIITSLVLFFLGIAGVLIRRNLIVILMCLELILNAVNLAFISFARTHDNMDGQVMTLLIFVVAAAEVAIGISIIINLFKFKGSLGLDEFNLLKR